MTYLEGVYDDGCLLSGVKLDIARLLLRRVKVGFGISNTMLEYDTAEARERSKDMGDLAFATIERKPLD